MAVTLRFVDSIADNPGVRLDLTRSPWWIDSKRTAFPPAPHDKAIASTMLTDGGKIPASAYRLRTIRLGLLLNDDDPDDAAAALAALQRELYRERNILELRVGTTNSVFFTTHRASPDTIDDLTDGTQKDINVDLLADPFARGPKETALAASTINMNPAAANGLFRDLADIKGDVETPLRLTMSGSQLSGFQSAVGIRRRGTPSNFPFFLQAEAMTQGTNTTTQANDATMSGSSNNFSRCTFTTATLATRLSTSVFPPAAGVDARGIYRVFARIRRSSATGEITMKLNSNPAIVTPLATTIQMVELGQLAIPGGMDPQFDGPSGVELPARGTGLVLQAARASGTSTLDVDYLLFLPADQASDRLAFVNWPTTSSANYHFDGESGSVYATDTTTGAVEASAGWWTGLAPMLTPGQTNRLYFLRKILGLADAVGDAVTATVEYWPRYVNVRQVGG